MTKSSVDKSRSRYGKFVTLRFHKPLKLYHLTWNNETPKLIAKFSETDGEYAIKLWETLEQLHEENERLKQAYIQLKHRHSLLHDVCIDAECERDGLKKDVESLEKENTRIKQQLEDIDKLICDLGSDEFRRQYGEIMND